MKTKEKVESKKGKKLTIVLLVIAVVMLGIVILNQLKKASDNSNSEEFKRIKNK